MMKVLRYRFGDEVCYGMVEDDRIAPLEGRFPHLKPGPGRHIPLAVVTLLAPCEPTRIVSCGPGFKSPYRERSAPERPLIWHKPLAALNHHDGTIELPGDAGPPVNYEAELAIVIGRRTRCVSLAEAGDHIFGFTCCNDVTRGDFATAGSFAASPYFLHGKTYDGFAPIGPWIVTGLDVADLRIACRINGATRQDHRTSDRLFSPEQLVSWLSHMGTLNPGDVISMGSPPGIGPLCDGDVCEVDIEGIGVLRNRVQARTQRPALDSRELPV